MEYNTHLGDVAPDYPTPILAYRAWKVDDWISPVVLGGIIYEKDSQWPADKFVPAYFDQDGKVRHNLDRLRIQSVDYLREFLDEEDSMKAMSYIPEIRFDLKRERGFNPDFSSADVSVDLVKSGLVDPRYSTIFTNYMIAAYLNSNRASEREPGLFGPHTSYIGLDEHTNIHKGDLRTILDAVGASEQWDLLSTQTPIIAESVESFFRNIYSKVVGIQGIHAFRSLEDVFTYISNWGSRRSSRINRRSGSSRTVVIGEVQLGGLVMPHDNGYTSEYAKVHRIYDIEGGLGSRAGETYISSRGAQELASTYGVELQKLSAPIKSNTEPGRLLNRIQLPANNLYYFRNTLEAYDTGGWLEKVKALSARPSMLLYLILATIYTIPILVSKPVYVTLALVPFYGICAVILNIIIAHLIFKLTTHRFNEGEKDVYLYGTLRETPEGESDCSTDTWRGTGDGS